MAKIAKRDILLKTGDKIRLGDNQEHEIYWDGESIQGVGASGTGGGTGGVAVTGAMVWGGLWEQGISYQEQDVVRLAPDAYVCNEDHTSTISNAPSSTPELLVTINTEDFDDITEDLTNFPVPISITNNSGITSEDVTGFIDAVGKNYNRLQAYNVNTGEKLYCDIEEWNTSASRAALHVSVPTLTYNQNVQLSIKFEAEESSFTGLTGTIAATNVWREYRGVYHFNNIPKDIAGELIDAARGNDGEAQNMDFTNTSAAPVGRAYDFKGDNDYVEIPNNQDWWLAKSGNDDPFTLEALLFPRSNTFRFMTKGALDEWEFSIDGANFLKIQLYDDIPAGSGEIRAYDTYPTSAYNAWTFVAATYDGSALDTGLNLHRNNKNLAVSRLTNGSYDGMIWNGSVGGKFGSVPAIYGDGLMAEARIAEGERSVSWLNATYYGLTDNLNTLEFQNNEGKWDTLIKISEFEKEIVILSKSSSDNQNIGGSNGNIVWWTWDGQVRKDDIFIHSLFVERGLIYVGKTGTYKIKFLGNAQQTGANRVTLHGVYRINGGTTKRDGTIRGYSRGSGYGNLSFGLKTYVELNKGDYIEVGTRIEDTDAVYTINACDGTEVTDEENRLHISYVP